MTSKTTPPKEEAKNKKETFGEKSEKPASREPDPTTMEKNADDHDRVAQPVRDELSRQQVSQEEQWNPDQHQRDIHQPTTQDVLADPVSRPKTIDPATGQIHYVGENAALPGGTVQHENDV